MIRKLLRDRLCSAWEDVVRRDYERQRINSERSLQAAFWARLNERLPMHQRMFIEPRFKAEAGGPRCIPDIVTCSKRKIICVIELKYRPRGKPWYRKDVRSMNSLACAGSDIKLSNDRFDGRVADSTIYKFSTTTLFVWAGIHRPPKSGSFKNADSFCGDHAALAGRFMSLHAETIKNDCPYIFSVLSRSKRNG